MTGIEQDLTLDAKADPWAPTFTGVKLTQLRHDWIARSNGLSAKYLAQKIPSRRFEDVLPVKSIALVGAVRNHLNGKLNLRDELACQAIMREFLPHIPLSNDCAVDIFNLSEKSDIFLSDKKFDLIIFCNIRRPSYSIMRYFNSLNGNDILHDILKRPRSPQENYGRDIDRALADTLLPSDILSGVKYSGIASEHRHYVTVSPKALEPDAYAKLVKQLGCRFVATWGFIDYIDGNNFSEPSAYDFSRSPGQRLLNRTSFTMTHRDRCGRELILPYDSDAKKCMLFPPYVDFAVCNQEWETIAGQKSKADSPLFGAASQTLEKMQLIASAKQERGRRPIASNSARNESIDELRRKLARPLNWAEKIERSIRQSFS
jgi:hypothetical protein